MTDRTSTAALRAQTKDALKAAGISQAAAARQLGLSTKHMSHMLTGRAALTLNWADRILALCDASLVLVATRNQATPPGPRIALDDLTSDQLDALYDERDRAQRSATYRLGVLGKRRHQICGMEEHMERAARVARSAASAAATALTHQLAAEQRADQAEAAIERVRAIHSHGRRTNTCNDCGQPWPCEVTRALAQAQPRTAEKAAGHNHADSL